MYNNKTNCKCKTCNGHKSTCNTIEYINRVYCVPCYRAIIRVSISYRSSAAQTDPLGLNAPVLIDLAVPDPSRGIVRSEAQTRAYGLVFRKTLDLLAAMMPGCHRVHLFYAGPMALAFHLGQQVSENIHPPVLAWHFHGAYEWAIDLAAAVTGELSIVRPPVELERKHGD